MVISRSFGLDPDFLFSIQPSSFLAGQHNVVIILVFIPARFSEHSFADLPQNKRVVNATISTISLVQTYKLLISTLRTARLAYTNQTT